MKYIIRLVGVVVIVALLSACGPSAKRNAENCIMVGDYASSIIYSHKTPMSLADAIKVTKEFYQEHDPVFKKSAKRNLLMQEAGNILRVNWDLFVSLPRQQTEEIAKLICSNRLGKIESD